MNPSQRWRQWLTAGHIVLFLSSLCHRSCSAGPRPRLHSALSFIHIFGLVVKQMSSLSWQHCCHQTSRSFLAPGRTTIYLWYVGGAVRKQLLPCFINGNMETHLQRINPLSKQINLEKTLSMAWPVAEEFVIDGFPPSSSDNMSCLAELITVENGYLWQFSVN